MPDVVKFLRSKGYPLKIRGNGGYRAVLCGIQWLNDGQYEAIYRYADGCAVHALWEIKHCFEVVEW